MWESFNENFPYIELAISVLLLYLTERNGNIAHKEKGRYVVATCPCHAETKGDGIGNLQSFENVHLQCYDF